MAPFHTLVEARPGGERPARGVNKFVCLTDEQMARTKEGLLPPSPFLPPSGGTGNYRG